MLSYAIIIKQKENIAMEAKELGNFIAANRKKKEITQAELAKRLNVTDKAVSRWERGVSHS